VSSVSFAIFHEHLFDVKEVFPADVCFRNSAIDRQAVAIDHQAELRDRLEGDRLRTWRWGTILGGDCLIREVREDQPLELCVLFQNR